MSGDSHSSEENVSEEETKEAPPPKKKGRKAATTPKKKVKESSDADDNEEKPKKGRSKGGKKRKPADHPRTIDMVLEAIENLEEKQGSSVQAIKGYILNNFKVREDMIKNMLRRALTSALKDRLIVRPKSQAEKSQVLSGRYLIRVKQPDEIPPPKPRPSQLRQLNVLKGAKRKSTDKKRRKKKKKGSY